MRLCLFVWEACAFTAGQQALLARARGAWTEIQPNNYLNELPVVPGNIHGAPGFTMTMIFVDPTLPPTNFYTVALHEYGHALCRVHNQKPWSIMNVTQYWDPTRNRWIPENGYRVLDKRE
jgi:hypothetical protein